MSTSEFHSVVSEFFDIQDWGTLAVLIKTNPLGYNAATSQPSNSVQEISVKAIPFDYVSKSEGTGTNSNTLIKSGDKQVFIKPDAQFSTIDPSKDKLRMGNVTYKIVTVKEVNPTLSDPLYYELFVRR